MHFYRLTRQKVDFAWFSKRLCSVTMQLNVQKTICKGQIRTISIVSLEGYGIDS